LGLIHSLHLIRAFLYLMVLEAAGILGIDFHLGVSILGTTLG
jgi:hypothetical protein